jgi:hypothetical protein
MSGMSSGRPELGTSVLAPEVRHLRLQHPDEEPAEHRG